MLFALLGDDGSPIMLTDSRDAAIANAWEHELETAAQPPLTWSVSVPA